MARSDANRPRTRAAVEEDRAFATPCSSSEEGDDDDDDDDHEYAEGGISTRMPREGG
jgi:hypothetical protein